MELPLELVTTAGELIVTGTDDHSRTRLRVTAVDRWSRSMVAQDVTVHDVQTLAGALLRWLADEGHDLPDLPATGADLELVVLPEHTRG
jgi:hypothetical protein